MAEGEPGEILKEATRKASIDEETGVISIIDVPPKIRKRRRRVQLQQIQEGEDGGGPGDVAPSETDTAVETVTKTRKRRVKKVLGVIVEDENASMVESKPKKTRRTKVASTEGEGLFFSYMLLLFFIFLSFSSVSYR